MITLILFSALAGLVTVLSPCILPILSLLLSAGIGEGRLRPLGVIVGLVVSFSFFTLALTSLVRATGISPDILRYCAIALIIFFGLTMIFDNLGNHVAAAFSGIARLGTKLQAQSQGIKTGFWSGFVLGIALGLLWTPCAGPILATITALVATNAITGNAVMLTLAYSLGAALPMFLIAYGGSKIATSTGTLAHYSEPIRKLFGVLMIIGAVAVAFHADTYLQQLAIRYFPVLVVEDNPKVRKELEALQPSKGSSLGDQAPDFVGIIHWINSAPLSIAQLRGKVVLVDFWTYSCINCLRTIPYLKQWNERYKDKGFVIIGVHTPEFEFEKNLHNVEDAVRRLGITYPVAMDNNYSTWQQYSNHYWPAHYLIDQEGVIREKHSGEGNYDKTENAIRKLLSLPPVSENYEFEAPTQITPETYLGYERARGYQPEIRIHRDIASLYSYTGGLKPDCVGLKGLWLIEGQSVKAQGDCTLDLNFQANRVYLVMKSETPQKVMVLLDGKKIDPRFRTADMDAEGYIEVHEPRMYDILDLKGLDGRHILTLKIPEGVSAYAFTFGSKST